MGNSTAQTPLGDFLSDSLHFPLPPSPHSELNAPISYFPPLKLGHSRDSSPPLLFPLVPTQQITPKDLDCPGTSQGSAPDHSGTEGRHYALTSIRCVGVPNPRDSWSYWTGGKARLGKVHVGEQIQGEDVPAAHQIADEEPDVDLGKFEPTELVPGSPQERPQLPQNQDGQFGETKSSGPGSLEKIDSPLSILSTLIQQPGTTRKELHPTSPAVLLPSHEYNIFSHMTNDPPSFANDYTPGRGALQGDGSHSTPNRRSYSLTMSSHPPFRLAQSSPTSGRQRRVSLPQGPGIAANGRQFHRMRPGPYPPEDPLQRRCSLRRSPSRTTHSKAFEKRLLRNSSGRSASSPYPQHYKTGQTVIPFTNSYQPPHDIFTSPKRYNTRSLRSNNSTNFSYPRTYSEPPSSKRRSNSSGSTYSGTRYGDRSTPIVLLGNGGNSSHINHETSEGIARRMSGGNGKAVLRDFQGYFDMHCGITPNAEEAQVNEGTLIASRRPSLQSQSPYQPNFVMLDRPTVSPTRTSSYRSVSEPWGRMGSSNYDMLSSGWRNSRMGLDGEFQDNGLATGYTNSNMDFPLGGSVNINNFGFMTTVDAASRPYTPDQFVTEAGLTHRSSTATRNPSKKSAGSWGSTRNARRKSVGSAGSAYTVSRSSSGHGRNVLRKPNPTPEVWPSAKLITRGSWDAGDNSVSSSPASATATVGLGIIDAFRERRKVAKELADAAEHPHTATTRAGPTRGIIRENSPPVPLRPDVYQPDASESRLNSLARRGKAKYEATTREIRQHISAQKGSEKVKRVDAFSPPTNEQDPTNPRKYKNGGNPSTMKFDNTSQPDTARITTKATIELQATNADAVRVKSSSASGYISISTVYHESQRIAEKIWERGIGGRFANLRGKENNTARNLRYGAAGKKVKVYMRGARSESLTMFEKIGRNLGIRKGKASTEAEQIRVDTDESDPFGISLCGAIDVTEGRGSRNSDGQNEKEICSESPISVWKEFEEGELADPVKLKLEGEGSKKYWSSRGEVEAQTTWWGRVRKLVKK